MFLTNRDMLDLIELRHDLHRHPEISGEEKETARRIRNFLEQAKRTGLLPISAATASQRSMTAEKAVRRS